MAAIVSAVVAVVALAWKRQRDRLESLRDQGREAAEKTRIAAEILRLRPDGRPASERIRIGTPHSAYFDPARLLAPLLEGDVDQHVSQKDIEELVQIYAAVKAADEAGREVLARCFEETWPRFHRAVELSYPAWVAKERALGDELRRVSRRGGRARAETGDSAGVETPKAPGGEP